VPGLAAGQTYTVVVGAASAAGVSYSGFAYGTPAATDAGLPITGPGLGGVWLLLGAGVAVVLMSRRPPTR
jgi:hypothetical protein